MRVATDVERPMEGEFHIWRVGAQRRNNIFMDIAIGSDRADDGAGCAEGARVSQVGAHHGDVRVVIDEAAAARTDDREDPELELFQCEFEHAVARRRAGVTEVVAKFDAIGAALFRVVRRRESVDARLDHHRHAADATARGRKRSANTTAITAAPIAGTIQIAGQSCCVGLVACAPTT